MGTDQSVPGGQSDAATVHERVAEVQELFNRGDFDAVVTASRSFAERFGRVSDPWVAERTAYVLLLDGIALRRLERGQESVSAFDRLSSSFGTSSDPDVRDHVVRGLINRAQTLDGLGRREEAAATYDAVIAEYQHDRDPRVGRRVSWAIWNKAKLLEGPRRAAEQEDLYDRLAHRHDEGVEPSLDNNIAWCIQHRAWALSVAGDFSGQIEACDELVERFELVKAPTVRARVLDALRMKAAALENLGELDAGLAVCDEIVARFGATSEAEIRDGIAEALRQKAIALGRHGRQEEAIAALDSALSTLAGPEVARSSVEATRVLLTKGLELGKLARAAEAVVVFDSVVAAYRSADVEARTPDGLVWAVMALTYKVSDLCQLGRGGEAGAALEQLVQALGDVTEPPQELGSLPAPAGEDELARAFADVFATDECWRVFDSPTSAVPQQEAAQRALNLYRLTEPWLSSEESGLAVQVAAGFLRNIADGYALLARSWSTDELARLPLPTRAEERQARLMRRFGLDDWLAEHGFGALSELAERVEDDEWPITPERDEERDTDQFWKFFLSTVHSYGLRLALCDSPSGREILDDVNLRNLACRELSTARRWVGWLGAEHEIAPAAVMSLFMAQGAFMTSYAKPRSSQDIFPTRQMLCEMLDDDELRNRLEDEGGALPVWLSDQAAGSD